MPVCIAHSGAAKGNYVFYVLVMLPTFFTLGFCCRVFFLPWLNPSSPFSLSFGIVQLRWVVNF